jgi:small subunit ribosomal protein S17
MTEQPKIEVNQRKLVGEVVSDKMDKTIVVLVSRRVRHPRYQKVITKHKKFYAHDEKQEAGLGDTVSIVGTVPLSKLKRWRLESVIEKAATPEKAAV